MTRIINRREFIKVSSVASLGLAVGCSARDEKFVVSVVRIKNDKIAYAVEKAIDLLGGIETVARGRDRIMLKPNLVAESPTYTTKPTVVRALAGMMQRAGKEVTIGEGSAAADGFNFKDEITYRTKRRDILDPMQQYVFDQLGYTDLARSMKIPLINLHSGDLVEVPLKNGFIFDRISLHRSLTETDMLCSVPMMKTHVLATVSLGMKNLIGLYPGTIYHSVRSWVHEQGAGKKSPGVAFEILDMVQASKPGLTLVDGSMAMEGDGPTGGSLVKTDLIIAGTDPLATDLVAAAVMGFKAEEVPTFVWAVKSGMRPADLKEIEIRGERVEDVEHGFVKPNVVPWTAINKFWGIQEL